MSKSVFIALPTTDGSCKGFMTALMAVYSHAVKSGWKVAIQEAEGVPHDNNRNHIMSEFLQSGCEWLLTIDSDIIPPANIVGMITPSFPCVVSADCRTMIDDVPSPTALRIIDGVTRRLTAEELHDGVNQVDGAGTGCMAIHREIVEAIGGNWFRFKYNDKGFRVFGEDYDFCSKVSEAGYPMFYDTRFKCGHVKSLVMWGDKILPAALPVIGRIIQGDMK